MKKLLVLFSLLAVLPIAAKELDGNVINIVNGYIFELITSEDKLYVIRLYGVDAPSLSQLHGDEAKSYLGSLIYGQSVKVIYDSKDNWGYILGKVYLNDKRYVNRDMVATGHAWWEEEYAGNDSELKAAEQEARQKKLVVWSTQNVKTSGQAIHNNISSAPAAGTSKDTDKAGDETRPADRNGMIDVVKTFKALKQEIETDTKPLNQ